MKGVFVSVLLNAFADVITEMEAQDNQWGKGRHLPSTLWGIVLGEEYGEVCEAILDAHHDPSTIGHLREELLDLVAVGTQMILAIDEERMETHIHTSNDEFG